MRTLRPAITLVLLLGCGDELAERSTDGGEETSSLGPAEAEVAPVDEATKADTAIDASPDAGPGGWYLTAPRCGGELLPAGSTSGGGSNVPQHPLTYVDVIEGAERVPSATFPARWSGLRKLAAPEVRRCSAAFLSTPAGLPCSVDTVIELTTTAGGKIEILIGLAHADLARFADGRDVSVLLGPITSSPEGSPSRSLEIREGQAGALLVAVHVAPPSTTKLEAVRWDDLQLSFGEPDCVTERDSCARVFVSHKLAVTTSASTQQLAPGQSADVRSKEHGYRLTYRRGVDRAYGVSGERECADLSFVSAGAELVQLP